MPLAYRPPRVGPAPPSPPCFAPIIQKPAAKGSRASPATRSSAERPAAFALRTLPSLAAVARERDFRGTAPERPGFQCLKGLASPLAQVRSAPRRPIPHPQAERDGHEGAGGGVYAGWVAGQRCAHARAAAALQGQQPSQLDLGLGAMEEQEDQPSSSGRPAENGGARYARPARGERGSIRAVADEMPFVLRSPTTIAVDLSTVIEHCRCPICMGEPSRWWRRSRRDAPFEWGAAAAGSLPHRWRHCLLQSVSNALLVVHAHYLQF